MLLPAEVTITPHEHGLLVSPIWEGVDRPSTGGIVTASQHNAERLKAAYLSGAAFNWTEIATDVNGNTYVAISSRIMGKYLNADLRRLGY